MFKSLSSLVRVLDSAIVSGRFARRVCLVGWSRHQRLPPTHFFSSKGYYKLQPKAIKEDPFKVLGLSRQQQRYDAVKKAFLRIAMKYHPDTAKAANAEEEAKNRDMFIAARRAFEEIVEGPDGLAILRSESDKAREDDGDMDLWFKSETGFDMPFMSRETMREVAEMTEKVGGGLDRDGGMWTLARMVAQSVKDGGDGSAILQLESGTVRDQQIDGVLRRKKRK